MNENRIKCLFVMEDHPISPNAPGGGPVTMYSRLELLARANLEIHLVLLREANESFGFDNYVKNEPEVWSRVRSWCVSHCVIDLRQMPTVFRRPERLRRLLLALTDPKSYPYKNVNEHAVSSFRKVITQVRPDVIWAENLTPAVLAWRSIGDIPIVYGHHDWISRVLRLHYRWRKTNTWDLEFYFWALKRIELALVREVAGCVTTSASEAGQLNKLHPGHAAYIPITYAPADVPAGAIPVSPSRVVHVGGMGTVANRIGLQRFLDVAWPVIRDTGTPPELWTIGDMRNGPELLLSSLEQAGARSPGFVPDLGAVLRPYDIQIVPWEHNTGARMKIPLVLNYAQVVVSTKAAAACLPELKDGENCVLVDDLKRMGRAIVDLLFDEANRKRIGLSGRKTFVNHFTREAVQPGFNQFISELPLGTGSRPHIS